MITLFFSPKCKGCKEAKEYLEKQHIPHKALDLTKKENREARSEFRKIGVDALPIITGLTIDGMDTVLYGWKESHKEKLRKNSYELSKEEEEKVKQRMRELGYL